jgi:tetratricopeptide (TPR) repeat protein
MLAHLSEVCQTVEEVGPVVEKHGTPVHWARYFMALIWRGLKRDDWKTSQDTLHLAHAMLAMCSEARNLFGIAWARYYLGLCLCHGDELAAARQELQSSLALGSQAGHTNLQGSCLKELSVVYRRLGMVDEARRQPRSDLCQCAVATVRLYLATATANRAWLAWHAGDLDEAEARGREALAIWESMSWVSEHHWMALWPLIAVALARDRVAEAVDYARPLLDETQERMPEAVERQVEQALAAWDGGEAELARERLERAVALAEEAGYL